MTKQAEMHPLELFPDMERRQISLALPREVWGGLDRMMQVMEEIDPGGSPIRFGYLLMDGWLQLRSISRNSRGGVHGWNLFLQELKKVTKADEAACGVVPQSHYNIWRLFLRIAWGMWWRYQLVNIPSLLLLSMIYRGFEAGPMIETILFGIWAVSNLLILGLAVSRAFNVYVQRYRSLPVLFGKPYG
jgi:hypothetical protein